MKTMTKEQFEFSRERMSIENYLEKTFDRLPHYDWMQNYDGQFIVGFGKITLRFTMEGGFIKLVEEISYK